MGSGLLYEAHGIQKRFRSVVEDVMGFVADVVFSYPWSFVAGVSTLACLLSLGLLKLQINDDTDLFVPKKSSSFRDFVKMQSDFALGPSPSLNQVLALVLDGGNILEDEIIEFFWEIDGHVKQLEASYNNNTVVYKDVCQKSPGKVIAAAASVLYGTEQVSLELKCESRGLLALWGGDRRRYDRDLEEGRGGGGGGGAAALAAANRQTLADGSPHWPEMHLGRIKRDPISGNITGAEAALLEWPTYFDPGPYEELSLAGLFPTTPLGGEAYSAANNLSLPRLPPSFSSPLAAPGTRAWETAFSLAPGLRGAGRGPGGRLTLHSFNRVLGSAGWEASRGDLTALAAAAVLLMVALGGALAQLRGGGGRGRRLRWLLGALGVLSSLLSVGAGFGLCGLLGLEGSLLNLALPMVLLGIGVDDMFLILCHWEAAATAAAEETAAAAAAAEEPAGAEPAEAKSAAAEEETEATAGAPPSSPPPLSPPPPPPGPPRRRRSPRARLVHAMRDVGPSIAFTTLSDALAFGLCNLSELKAIQNFGTYAAICVIFDFVFQITLFVGYLVIITRMEAHGPTAYDTPQKQAETPQRRASESGVLHSRRSLDGIKDTAETAESHKKDLQSTTTPTNVNQPVLLRPCNEELQANLKVELASARVCVDGIDKADQLDKFLRAYSKLITSNVGCMCILVMAFIHWGYLCLAAVRLEDSYDKSDFYPRASDGEQFVAATRTYGLAGAELNGLLNLHVVFDGFNFSNAAVGESILEFEKTVIVEEEDFVGPFDSIATHLNATAHTLSRLMGNPVGNIFDPTVIWYALIMERGFERFLDDILLSSFNWTVGLSDRVPSYNNTVNIFDAALFNFSQYDTSIMFSEFLSGGGILTYYNDSNGIPFSLQCGPTGEAVLNLSAICKSDAEEAFSLGSSSLCEILGATSILCSLAAGNNDRLSSLRIQIPLRSETAQQKRVARTALLGKAQKSLANKIKQGGGTRIYITDDHFVYTYMDSLKGLRNTTLASFVYGLVCLCALSYIFLGAIMVTVVVTASLLLVDMTVFAAPAWAGSRGTANLATTVMVLVSFGLVVDYLAHFVSAYEKEKRGQGSQAYYFSKELIERTLLKVGPSMVLVALTSFLATLPLFFSVSRLGRDMGQVYAAIVLTGFVHGCMILPAFIYASSCVFHNVIIRKRARKQTTDQHEQG